MAGRNKTPFVQASVSKEMRDKYYQKCEALFGNKRQSAKPIRTFIKEFTEGRVYIVDGEIIVKSKK